MKRFIVLTVLAVAMTMLFAGTAFAYTDYIPFLSKGAAGAVPHGFNATHGTDAYGNVRPEAPEGMPDIYSSYALGCFYCHGFEKHRSPNRTDVVDLTRVLTSPTVTINAAYASLPSTVTVGDVFGGDYIVGSVVVPAATPVNALAGAQVQALAGYNEDDAAGTGGTEGTLVSTNTANGRWSNVVMQIGQPYGPHGGYSNTTDRCKVCHDVHAAAGSKRLTAGSTAEDICETCHDFTEGISIYGAIEEMTGEAPAGGHRIKDLYGADQTTDPDTITPSNPYGITSSTVIPGYMPGTANQAGQNFPQTGGVYSYTTASLASRESDLTCTDCHTPHGNTSMRPFKGDRVRLGEAIVTAAALIQPLNITSIHMDTDTAALLNAAALANTDVAQPWALVCNDVVGSPTLPEASYDVDLSALAGGAGLEPFLIVDICQLAGIIPPQSVVDTVTNINGTLGYSAEVLAGLTNPDHVTGGLVIDPTTATGERYAFLLADAQGHNSPYDYATVPWSGVALAAQGALAGAMEMKIGVNGLDTVNLASAPSNKLLRDYVNGLDLRDQKFAGQAPTVTGNSYNDYDQTLENQLYQSSADINGDEDLSAAYPLEPFGKGIDGAGSWAGNSFNNGQMGAKAEYGSGFCYGCHRGRLGNYVGLVDSEISASRDQSRLDSDFENIEIPPGVTGYMQNGVAATMSDSETCLNHPTLMSLPYRLVGPMNSATYNSAGTAGDPGTYDAAVGLADYERNKYGLARSNKGYVFWPVNADTGLTTGVHTDGRLGSEAAMRPTAPICQQCHEDYRDVESAFVYSYGRTDKSVGFARPVNSALGLATGKTVGDLNPANDYALGASFIYEGNPLFGNFPHESQGFRLLVEGGDSNTTDGQNAGTALDGNGGGGNDDLCLNCHVPGSVIRPDDSDRANYGQIIFTTLVKDFNGFQE